MLRQSNQNNFLWCCVQTKQDLCIKLASSVSPLTSIKFSAQRFSKSAFKNSLRTKAESLIGWMEIGCNGNSSPNSDIWTLETLRRSKHAATRTLLCTWCSKRAAWPVNASVHWINIETGRPWCWNYVRCERSLSFWMGESLKSVAAFPDPNQFIDCNSRWGLAFCSILT